MTKKMFTGAGIALAGFITGAFTVMVTQSLTMKLNSTIRESVSVPEESAEPAIPTNAADISEHDWLRMHLVRRGLNDETAQTMLDMAIKLNVMIVADGNRPTHPAVFNRLRDNGFSQKAVEDLIAAASRADVSFALEDS